MTSRSAHFLALVALGMLVASGPAFAQTDYDTDNDNLIDITSLAQLNAIRYDLNGDGTVATTDTMNYNAAFPNAMSGMGCAATCNGYELMNNLNLASYSEWTPIGSPFATTFDGNGYTLTGLKITNGSTYTGLFGQVGPAGVIRDLGIINGSVRSGINLSGVGMLTGENNGGTITGCYAEGGTVYFGATGTNIGGLAGGTQGTISASYSTATMRQEGGRSVTLGGLVGFLGQQGALHGMIIDSYAAAPWSSTQGNANPTTGGGLLGTAQGANVRVTGSYCDTSVAAWSQCISTGTANTTAASKTTADLQNPLGYTGIYANWNIDVNGDRVPDNPWNFGTTSQYPTLKTPTQRQVVTDYDSDNDGLIDVTSLLQLNAIRYDLNGDGLPTGTNADTIAYAGAFPGGDITASSGRMGCPATGGCTGYELMNNLDFDENNDGSITSADTTYWNSGSGWLPIGTNTNKYTGNFKGNGYTINNLFISRSNTGYVGLFGNNSTSSRIETLGVINANVTGQSETGILLGQNEGNIVACYTTGAVTASGTSSGGLVGFMFSGSITTSYSTASVSGGPETGGLLGFRFNGSIRNSYSIGAVSGTGGNVGGLIGSASLGSVSNSYWNTQTSNRNSSPGGGTAQTTDALRSPTGYTGIYANWNIDLNGDRLPDNPWNFGTASQYPTLKTPTQRAVVIDYDSDNDGLIDVTSLDKLNAIRYDLNGDGLPTGTNADTIAYASAFPGGDITTSSGRMGCPSAGCTGYELMNSLDFDENNDGSITSADASYWNSGNGWSPIGTDANKYTGNFKGNGYTINNLFISRSNTGHVGLFGNNSTSSRIETLGVINANVTGQSYTGILIGRTEGNIVACYTTGAVTASNTSSGGLVGYQHSGSITTSYSTASVSGGPETGGLMGYRFNGSIINSYSIGAVSGTGSQIGGLVGGATFGSVSNSYWNTQTSNRNSSPGGGTGKTTSDLQSPTTYGATTSDTYYGWNANLDGQAGNDDPWTFGTTNHYPVLKYAGMDTTVQFQFQPAVVTLALTPSSISESGGMSTVTATLSHPSSAATTITVRPVAGAYTVGMDSTITIAAGSTANASDTVVITAVDNTRDELNRDMDMSVVADNAQGSVVRPVEITIIDDDPQPRLSISSPSAVEGTALTFTVRLNAVSGKEVTVAYADAGTGTATSGTDYTALTAGTLTFAAGTTSQTIAVTVTGDSDDEQNETVIVTLSSATNATISTAQGTGTIIDDDGMPALSIGSPSVIEGATSATLTFQVYLRPAHTAQVTVAYADAGTGTATSGTDYTALTAGTLTFAVGDTIQTIPVSVTDDSDDEQNETVIVTLNSATNATISTAQGTGTIIDDETPSANLDVDGDGRVRLFSDIILVIRYVLFFREEALLRGNVIEPTATRTTAQEIEPYLDTLVNQNILDVDGDGDVRLFSDIILIIRYVLFFRNEALLRGNVIEQNATRTTAQAIEPYIRSLYPASHFQ